MWSFLENLFGSKRTTVSMFTEIIENQKTIMEMIMNVKLAIEAFAANVDAVTNAIAANVDVVRLKIEDLQAQAAAGDMTPEELAAALDPLTAHLQAVSDSLAAVASGGTTVTPPVDPIL